ncbi:MAG: chromosome partitioning protein ParB [SAR202 cluster bacterium]|nr:chromosome partitioning protein ParB [SAR202 cluster bacterium]
MHVVEIPIGRLKPAPWNPNAMDGAMLGRLRESVTRFGLVENLVVRSVGDGYEVLSGNQRLLMLQHTELASAPCVVVELDDAESRLLAMALNRIQGEDDITLKAVLVKRVLESIPQADVLSLLPETTGSLSALATLGEGDLASHLQAWQAAQAAKLRHLQFQLTNGQLELVEEALERALNGSSPDAGNPNKRGNALFYLCQDYLRRVGGAL